MPEKISSKSSRELAILITRELFTNRQGEIAGRLQLLGPGGQDLGTWEFDAAKNVIQATLERWADSPQHA